MYFELTEALIDDILFSMEDQNGIFYVDTDAGIVLGDLEADSAFKFDDSPDDEDRLIALPEWDSSEGFRLMERFAAGLKNSVIREKLTAALDRGKGVFRAFKDTLGLYPETEQLWFKFKEREMRRVIINWYNGLREEWGLERVGLEPDETGDLVLEDFRIREPREGDYAAVAALHRLCLGEFRRTAAWPFPGEQAVLPEDAGPKTLALVAETGGGDFAAYIAAEKQGAIRRITALEVRPEYRGMGIGEALLSHLLERTDQTGVSHILLDLPAEAEGFSRVLLRESFIPYMTCYSLNLTPGARLPPAEPLPGAEGNSGNSLE
jgi:GNAT superfamily N-acetyltransferase